MTPRIETIPAKKLVGLYAAINISAYNVAELWKKFIPLLNKIENKKSSDFFSISLYDNSYFNTFSPSKTFEKWVAIEVTEHNNLSIELSTFTIPSGMYAIFTYKGLSSDFTVFDYIYNTWLPSSNYILDNRPHFEILGSKYQNNDPNSEEEIYIPIQLK